MGVTRYELKNGARRYRADFYVQGPHGELHRVVKKGIPTKEMAQAYEAKATAAAFEGRWFDKQRAKPITVSEVWASYQPVAKRDNRSWATEVGRSVHILRHLGGRRAASLTRRDIDAYRQRRGAEENRYGRFPATGTVNREVAQLRHMLNHAVKYGDLDHNPLVGIEMLAENNVRDVVVSEAEFAKLHEAAEDLLKPILLVAYDTGLRKAAVLGLRWSEVDLRERCLRLKPADSATKKRPPAIPMTARLFEVLDALPRSTSGYVFVNPQTNRPWNQIRKAFARARDKAGLPHIWFHDLRRGFITNARRRGVPESVIMRMSGHSTRAVFERYNIVNDEDLRAAVATIEAGREAEIRAERQSSDGNDLVTGTGSATP